MNCIISTSDATTTVLRMGVGGGLLAKGVPKWHLVVLNITSACVVFAPGQTVFCQTVFCLRSVLAVFILCSRSVHLTVFCQVSALTSVHLTIFCVHGQCRILC